MVGRIWQTLTYRNLAPLFPRVFHYCVLFPNLFIDLIDNNPNPTCFKQILHKLTPFTFFCCINMWEMCVAFILPTPFLANAADSKAEDGKSNDPQSDGHFAITASSTRGAYPDTDTAQSAMKAGQLENSGHFFWDGKTLP